jgi:hypothetical protein
MPRSLSVYSLAWTRTGHGAYFNDRVIPALSVKEERGFAVTKSVEARVASDAADRNEEQEQGPIDQTNGGTADLFRMAFWAK